MQNSPRDADTAREDKLDAALENSFPGSDPVSMTQPHGRYGAPKQHSQTAAQNINDGVEAKREKAGKIAPDYLWLGSAFMLGCIVGIAARSAQAPHAGAGYGRRLQRHLADAYSDHAPDLHLQKKLSQLLDRLH